MKRKTIWIPLLAMALLAGCGPLASLHPLYTKDDLVLDSRFQGNWQVVADGDDRCILTFQSAGHLQCTAKDGHESGTEVHLLQLGGFQFLDFLGEEGGDFQIPVHSFAKVLTISDGELRIVFVGTDWLEDRIEEASFPSYERVGKGETDKLLTGSTRDLQQFVLTYAVEPQAYEEHVTILRRVQ